MNSLKKIILSLFIVGNFSNLYAASFDCNQATRLIEKSICSNSELSTLDDELSIAYKNAVLLNPKVKLSQREWIKTSRTCENEPSKLDQCIKNAYIERLTILKGETNSSEIQAVSFEARSNEKPEPLNAIPEAASPLQVAPSAVQQAQRLKSLELLNDDYGVLSSLSSEYILKKLALIEKNGNSVIIVLTPDTGGVPISTYGNDLRKNQNKDISIVVDTIQNNAFISISEKIQTIITIQKLKDIFDKDLLPLVQRKDFATGLSLTLSGFENALNIAKIDQFNDIDLAKVANEGQLSLLNNQRMEGVSKSDSNESDGEYLNTFIKWIGTICTLALLAATVFAIFSVPFALYQRFKSGIIIIENLTDAAFTLSSLIAGFIFVGSLVGILSGIFGEQVKNSLAAIGAVIYFGGHIFWMHKVARRSNILINDIWTVTFARVLISCLPLVYLMLGEQPIQGKSSNESSAEYLIRYNNEVAKNKQREKDKKFIGLLTVALTTLSIDKFSFEGLSSYFGRKTAFVASESSASLVNA